MFTARAATIAKEGPYWRRDGRSRITGSWTDCSRATTEAAAARQVGPTDALAWIASAEVEYVRAQAARARGSAPDAALARGQASIEHAMTIDPRHVRTLKVRDQLANFAVER